MGKELYGMGYAKEKNWKERWKDIVETDHDYDGDYLIRLIVHKLGLMQTYFSRLADKESMNEDLSFSQAAAEITECYNLGNKILTYDYGKDADEWFEEHGSQHWLEHGSDSDLDYRVWKAFTDWAILERQSDIHIFFELVGTRVNGWWG